MGTYTGLRFKAIIKPKFAEVIKTMMDQNLDWLELYKLYPQYEFLKEFGEGFRADCIPYGSLSYMPDEWEIVPKKENGEYDWKNAKATDGFERNFDKETRLWSFQCSLKNYEADIEKFFEIVVPKIVEKAIHIEYYHEEWARSSFYELIEGKVIESDKKGILYRYEDDSNYLWD